MIYKLNIFLGCLLLLSAFNSPLQAKANVLLDKSFWQTASVAEVEAALKRGADIDARDEKNGGTPLHWAAGYSSEPMVVELLLSRGAAINSRAIDGYTPLHVAAEQSKTPAVVELLLERGADIDTRTEKTRSTPLHIAALYNQTPDVLNVLLDRGANGTVRDKSGKTPFYYAWINKGLIATKAYWRLNDIQS
ncbi:MAG: ankyrin repeat domain-containing protein [Parvularculales bacterium]